MSTKPKKSPNSFNAYAKYSALGIQMAVIIGGGCYAGYKLDEYLQTSTPIFTIVLSLLSIALAMYIVLKDFIKPNK